MKNPRSAFDDLYEDEPKKAASLNIRSMLMLMLEQWIVSNGFTHAKAVEVLGTTRPRVSNLVNGHIEKFSIDCLVDFCAAAGIEVGIERKGPLKKSA